MDALLHLIMGPWTTYLLWVLSQNGPLRFGVLKRQLPGISSRVLTQRLRMLETAGVIFRDHRPTIPPQVTYGLTQRGVELGDVLNGLEVIARRWDIVSETENIAKTLE
ncbi:MAG: transcriptional regulator [Alphaproteobacteria bacterium]|nr:MAG: transcriptional regulator [Alphaproteobacteria bacterium]